MWKIGKPQIFDTELLEAQPQADSQVTEKPRSFQDHTNKHELNPAFPFVDS